MLSTSYPFTDPHANISFEVRGRTVGAGVIWVSVEPCPSGPAQACLSGRGAGVRWPLGCRGSRGRPCSRSLRHLSCTTIFTWLLPTSLATRGQFSSSQSRLLAGSPHCLSWACPLLRSHPRSLPRAALGDPAPPASLALSGSAPTLPFFGVIHFRVTSERELEQGRVTPLLTCCQVPERQEQAWENELARGHPRLWEGFAFGVPQLLPDGPHFTSGLWGPGEVSGWLRRARCLLLP